MKKIIFLFIIALMPLLATAQNEMSQTIKGTVKDKSIEYPLIGVNVLLLNNETTIGTTTDENGNFKLENVPVGRQTIQFTYIGYQPVTIPNILVNSAKENVINVEMEEDFNKLAEVVVTDKSNDRRVVNEMAAISAQSMSIEEVTRFSGTFGDVARMAQNYAGVSGASDSRNDIIVRGNSPAGVLWRLEGVDIPSPNHWGTLGASGGPISMINTNNLRSSDFYSSAFAAEYGNATAAVFDLKLRNGNPDKFEFMGQIGFNGFEGGFEGPLKAGKNASFIANYRYSTLGVFNALGIDLGTGAAIPQYQDLTFKINLPTEKYGRFSIWGLGGISSIRFRANPDGENLYTAGDDDLTSATNTGVVGLNHLYFFDDKTSSNFSVALSKVRNTTLVQEITNEITGNLEDTFGSTQTQGKLSVNWTFNKKLNAKSRLKAGAIYDNYGINVLDSTELNNGTWFNSLEFEGNASLWRGFAQFQHKFSKQIKLDAGLHSAIFTLNQSTSLEPRIALTYQPDNRSTFSLGYGRHSQLQPLPVYFAKDEDATPEENTMNEELDFFRSNHFVVGWNYGLTSNTRFKLETYYQTLSDLAVDPDDGDFSIINAGAGFAFPNRTGLVNEGTGTNYGVELTLERSLDKGFYYLTTVSLFDSKYAGSDAVEHNTFFNSNYVINVLGGKEFVISDKFTLTFDARFNLSGGRRFTPIDIAASIAEGEEVLEDENIFGTRY
ncbi:MAG: TonB-dependent receptor, partial [Bacteroidota bacterium]